MSTSALVEDLPKLTVRSSASTSAEAYNAAAARYIKRNPKSQAVYEQACNSTPGGNTRTVLYYHPFPLCIAKGAGSTITDVDGHEYVDLLGEYTAGLYGHSDPIINKAIIEAVEKGIGYGSSNQDEVTLAQLIQQRFRSMELLRYTNSGTEANLMAIAIAKAFTGKSRILVFAGGYHGGVLSWKGCEGSPINAPHHFLIAKYNDVQSVRSLLASPENSKDLAAIIVEPMIGSGGAIPGDPAFLQTLRTLSRQHGALLIWDEVMTSRLCGGKGLQSRVNSRDDLPDLTTLGKYIGGGMSFGAFGGKREIMSRFDPREPNHIAHAGTFNNNVMSMAAGVAGLKHSATSERHAELAKHTNSLQQDLREICKGTIMQWTGVESIQGVHFTSVPWNEIRSPEDVAGSDKNLTNLFHLWLLERGYHIGRRGFLAFSFAVTPEQYAGFTDAVRAFVDEYSSLLRPNQAQL